MRNVGLLLFAVATSAVGAEGATLDDRIDGILARMSTEQKIAQLCRFDTWQTADDPELGIPGLHVNDGPHGVGWHNATCFPVTVAMAASWDEDLVYRIGQAIGREFRAKGKTQGLAPTVDVIRDPRSGRNPESPGEDPYLAARFGAAFVRGLQSTSCIATAKHFELNTRQRARHSIRPTVDDRTLFELYSPPFRTLIQETGVWSIMNAYNFVNGVRAAHNRHLMTDILRDRWGYFYYVISDWGSVHDAELALEAGTDLEMASGFFPAEIPGLLASGRLKMATLDTAVRRVLRTKLVSGLIDGQPLADLAHLDSEAHRRLAREAAQKSIVLLKNEGRVLPIDTSRILSVAVVGPSADVARLDGVGSSSVSPYYSVTPLAGIMTHAGPRFAVRHARGCDIQSDDTSGFAEAMALAEKSDMVVFVGGLDETMEGEERDRVTESIALPGVQCALIEALAGVNDKLVVVLEGGGAIGVNACLDSMMALVYAFYPGQEGGNAIADVLFGDVNPSGKLPYTIPKTDAQLPEWGLDHTKDLTAGRGYRWFDAQGLTPEFPFGHGLSYTTFKYSAIRVEPVAAELGQDITLSVDVTNTGTRAGDEIVQLYVRDEPVSQPEAPKELKRFARIHLPAGATQTVDFTIGAEDLAHFDPEAGAWVTQPGMKVALVGISSRRLASRAFLVKPTEPRADLVVSYLAWVPPFPEPGDQLSFLAMVRNRGHGPSPAGVAHEVVFRIDGKPVARAAGHTTAVPAGGAVMLQATHLAGASDWSAAAPGSFAIDATVNPKGRIAESIATNNARTATVEVRPRNLAANRPVEASSVAQPGFEGGRAVDGVISSKWSSAAAEPQHLTVDLGQPVAIDRVVLSWDFAFGRKYRVQVSRDAEAWTDLHVERDGDGAIDELAVAGTGRYVRLHATERATKWGYALWEMQVFGTPIATRPHP